MSGLPGGAALHPRYTKKSMIVILAITLLCTALLLLVFNVLVTEGNRVEQGIQDGASPLWNPSLSE